MREEYEEILVEEEINIENTNIENSNIENTNIDENSSLGSSVQRKDPPESSISGDDAAEACISTDADTTPRLSERKIGFFLGMLSGIILTMLAIVAGFTWSIIKEQKAREAALTKAQAEEEQPPTSVVSERTLSKMATIEKLIQDHFYRSEIDEPTLEEGIYDGMIAALNDEYAQYFTLEEQQVSLDKSEGVYYGIGAYISLDKELSFPFISGLLEDTPAGEAGLHDGDLIIMVDEVSTYQMSLNDVVSMVKGEEGTTVTLTILRDNETYEVDVVRAKINRETVSSQMLEDGIGYIQISEFDDVTIDQFTSKYAELKNTAKGLIIDLRGNPGGLLNSVVNICREFLPEGLIVYTQDKEGKRQEYTCDGKNRIEIPLVVLVNKGSASASEILTGAVKDYGIGTIIGTTTYGKGIVQKTYQLNDGSAVKMTTAAYFTPNGHNIQDSGIAPDVEVELDADLYYSEDRVDTQLEAAKAYLKEKMTTE